VIEAQSLEVFQWAGEFMEVAQNFLADDSE
jgi:hypothetical protein